jgi:hypothetical protein
MSGVSNATGSNLVSLGTRAATVGQRKTWLVTRRPVDDLTLVRRVEGCNSTVSEIVWLSTTCARCSCRVDGTRLPPTSRRRSSRTLPSNSAHRTGLAINFKGRTLQNSMTESHKAAPLNATYYAQRMRMTLMTIGRRRIMNMPTRVPVLMRLAFLALTRR